MYDSVYFFARALSKFVEQHSFAITSVQCQAQVPWAHGSAFALFIKTVRKKNESIDLLIYEEIISLKQMVSPEK